MDRLVNQRIQIEYYDHNDHFESIFPRVGVIVSRHSTENVSDWYLVNLEEAFEYNSRMNTHVMVRPRSQGMTLYEDDSSVFVLLIPNMHLVSKTEIEIDKFEHVVWGKTQLCRNT